MASFFLAGFLRRCVSRFPCGYFCLSYTRRRHYYELCSSSKVRFPPRRVFSDVKIVPKRKQNDRRRRRVGARQGRLTPKRRIATTGETGRGKARLSQNCTCCGIVAYRMFYFMLFIQEAGLCCFRKSVKKRAPHSVVNIH